MTGGAEPPMKVPAELESYITKGDPEALYEIITEVGQGSFGAVYKAREKSTGLAVAIKQMKRTSDDDWTDMLKEIRFLRGVQHPNIVRHMANYLKGSTIWIVMEFCIGSAADMIDLFRKPFQEMEIAAILHSVLPAIAYLHERKRIHRDIKAANILLTPTGLVKLGDFGSASMSDPANTFVGTPCWMAPEVIMAMESGLYTSKSDIWGLGITAIELAEKKPPLFEMNTMSALYYIPQNDPPTLAEPQLWSKEFQNFVAWCLQKNPDNRPSAQELMQHPFVANVEPKMHEKVLKAVIRRCKVAAAERDAEQARLLQQIAASETPAEPAPDAAADLRSASAPPPVTEPSTPSAGDQGRRRRFSAMMEVEDDLATTMADFHLNDEPKEIAAAPGQPRPLGAGRAQSQEVMERKDKNDAMRAQLRALKHLQARQKKHLKQLEKTHEQQKADQRKQADKETEAETKQQTSEADKLAARQRTAQTDHAKQQAKEMKEFLKKQAADSKARTKAHEAKLKQALKDMEKTQKAEKEAAPKASHKELKARFAEDLKKFKDTSNAKFIMEEERQVALDLHEFKVRQMERHHAFEQEQFEEHYKLLQDQKEQTKARRLRQLEAEFTLLRTLLKQQHELLSEQQIEVHNTELAQLDQQHQREEKDMRKRHQAEIKAQPKQIKNIRSNLERQRTDTIKSTRQRHMSVSKEMIQDLPKDEQKRVLQQQRIELEREVLKTNSEYERKINESIEKEAHDLEESQTKEEEALRQRQRADRESLANMQAHRRETLAAQQQKEMQELEATHRAAADELAASLEAEMAQFNATWSQKRAELAERHKAERAKLDEARPGGPAIGTAV